MPAGRTNLVAINLSTISEKFNEGDVVDLDILKERKIIKASGKMRNLPLKAGPHSLLYGADTRSRFSEKGQSRSRLKSRRPSSLNLPSKR